MGLYNRFPAVPGMWLTCQAHEISDEISTKAAWSSSFNLAAVGRVVG